MGQKRGLHPYVEALMDCPLSALLFIFVVEQLFAIIQHHQDIKGILFEIHLFVDDIFLTVFVPQNSIPQALEIIE